MAISITSLTPTKNEIDVGINSNIELTITSDDKDLDISTIEFYINTISIQVSAYYGVTNKIVDITFFSKKKIKYNTRRYGEEDVRYGQQDIFPSNFRYGQRYTCRIVIEDVDGNSFEENFSFVVEEGIFFNSSPATYYYSQQTQLLANYTPSWSRSRYDKFSNFQQIVNPTGTYIEEFENLLYKQAASYYLQTANINELATLYGIELGGDFEFDNITLDDGTKLQVPPEVYGIKEITKYDILSEFKNDIKNFYYDKLPTRLDETKINLTSEILHTGTIDSNEVELDTKLEREGSIYVSIENRNNFTIIKNDDIRFFYCRITGVSREDKKQIEDIIIISNENYPTVKLWSKITSVQFLNVGNDTGNFTVRYNRPIDSLKPDFYKNVNTEDDQKSVFWKLDSNIRGSILQQYAFIDIESVDIIARKAQKDLLIEYELFDVDNSSNINLVTIDTDQYNNFIYGINDDYLYIFDKRQEYPTVIKNIHESNGQSDFVLDIEDIQLGIGDSGREIGIYGVQKTANKTLTQYRIKVEKPDETIEYLLEDGTFTTDKNKGIIVANTRDVNYITQPFNYNLVQTGDYIFTLDSIYRDGSRFIDSKIIRVPKKAALVKYKLERLLAGETVVNMFIDYDQQLKIYDSNSEVHILKFAKDNMLIDYENSFAYFNENYDKIGVE